MHYEKFADGTVKCIEDEIPFEVPEGWAWTRLNSIYNFIDYRGSTPNKISKGIPLITAKNVKSGYIDYTIDDYISNEEFEKRQQRGISQIGDILFTTEAPLGNAALADIEKFSAGQRLITFQHYGIKNQLINYVMLMFILSNFFQQQLSKSKTGSTVSGIKAAILKTLLTPIPPYNEQIKLGNILKSIINMLDDMSENKETLKVYINNVKSKILDLAIQGKLVPQNPNDEPASVLLEQIRAEKEELIKQGKIKRDKKESFIFRGDDNLHYEKFADGTVKCIEDEIPFEVPEGWEWTRLQNISSILTDGTHKTPQYCDNGYIFLSSKNVTSGKIDWENITYIPKSLHEELYKRLAPAKGDILLAKNGTTGVAAIVDKDVVFDIYVSLALIRITNSLIESKYILSVIGSKYIQEYFTNSLKGIGVPNLHLEHIRKTFIPIPPYKEQLKIVEVMDKILQTIETMSKRLN